MRELVLVVLVLRERHTHNPLPRDERHIRIGKLVAHEPRSSVTAAAMFLFLLRQIALQDARHAVDFFGVALNGAGHLFRVEFLEKYQLSVVGALSRCLEVEPLFGMIRLWGSGSKTQSVFRVVALDEILDDGTGLPQGDVGVGVVDGWEPTVGVDGEVFGLLDIGESDGDDFVRETEFFQHDGDFGGVGTALAPDFDRFDFG